MLPGLGAKGNGELLFYRLQSYVGDDENVWGIDSSDGYTALWIPLNSTLTNG